MGKKTVRGHDIANRFVYSLKPPAMRVDDYFAKMTSALAGIFLI